MGLVTPLVERALLREGLLEVLEARRANTDLKSFERRLRGADLLALGALGDIVRRDEVGSAVRLHLDASPPDAIAARGLDLLREVAIARVLGPRAASVCVDFGASGLEIAQVALGFGASELAGPIANRRGLPIADAAQKKVKGKGMVALRALAREELFELVRRAGREALA
ncbi:MAG TPA: hypothetical protein VGH28_16030 [Polyangiaceae bacterium]|jgi:hypothetical protein